MPIEVASNISELVSTNPNGTDMLSTVDNHIRLLKSTLQSTFPSITGLATQAEAEAGTSTVKLTTPLAVKQAILANEIATTAGTYTKLTVDARGRITATASIAWADLPANPTLTGSVAITTASGSPNVEIGQRGVSNTPYFDFHSSATNTDYDSRIMASGGTATAGQGTLNYYASNHAFNGNSTVSGNAVISGSLSADIVLGNMIATQAEATAGTVANKIMTPQRTAQAISANSLFTKSFTSSQQTITSAGLLTIPHGLGGVPKLTTYRLVCLVANYNWEVGDVVEVSPGGSSSSATTVANSMWSDATNIYVRFTNDTSAFLLANKTTGVPHWITNSQWALIVSAYY